jgi:predicted enzyme related to lactoylglutathione lyase
MAPMAHGKICYLELPATDVDRSTTFYSGLFGWTMRTRGDGAVAFDDAGGYVSGAFVTKRAASTGAPGLLVYVMVDSIEAAVTRVQELGGEIVQPVGVDAPELTARFRDPSGNVIGLYEEPRKK